MPCCVKGERVRACQRSSRKQSAHSYTHAFDTVLLDVLARSLRHGLRMVVSDTRTKLELMVGRGVGLDQLARTRGVKEYYRSYSKHRRHQSLCWARDGSLRQKGEGEEESVSA